MTLDTTIGGASSDSYGTLADYQAYLAKVGYAGSGDDTTDEQHLRRAVMYLDRSYSWVGTKVEADQALQWPRNISYDIQGFPVPSTAIPQAIIDAQFEMAYLIQGGADPFATISDGAVQAKREKVDVIEREYTFADGTGRDRPTFVAVDQLVGPYVTGKAGGGVFSLSVIRA